MIANKAHQPQAGQKPRFFFVITFINNCVKIKLNICLAIDKWRSLLYLCVNNPSY